jgi:hypothetical protein
MNITLHHEKIYLLQAPVGRMVYRSTAIYLDKRQSFCHEGGITGTGQSGFFTFDHRPAWRPFVDAGSFLAVARPL